MATTWLPGWSARLNGEAVPLYRANLGFMAVPLPEGGGEVTLRYQPRMATPGLALSLLGLLLTGGLLAWGCCGLPDRCLTCHWKACPRASLMAEAMQQRGQLRISERRLLLRLGDAACNFLAVLIALRIWAGFSNLYTFDAGFVLNNIGWFFLLQSLWFLLASANDFYDLRLTASTFGSATRLLQITLQMLIVYLLIFFLSPREALPRLFILYYGVGSFVLISLWRTWRPFLIGWTHQPRRAIVAGSGWAARQMMQVLELEATQEYTVVGVITEEDKPLGTGRLLPVKQSRESVLQFAASVRASEIILAYESRMSGQVFQQIVDAYEQGYTIVPMPILFEQITGRVPIEYVGQEYWNVVLPIQNHNLFSPNPVVKRLLDVVLALTGSVLFAGLLPWIALAIYLDSPGPIFFRQERVGRGGRPFYILKLRTMVPDAEKLSGPVWASERDPRITRIGRFLRKTRLDELPQLINVLRGEMSLVGPRPERPHFVEQLSAQIPFYRTRHIIKPGVTGWAQVRYGYGNSVEDALIKLQYDLYYIRHQNLTLDVLILLRTVGKVLKLAGN
ncbi:MAG: exopolysaccharide biosynthesis polyprenyl glycosylphosphotransferase [Anaerolineae bacterium]|nr:exopolysaccharide biosynthesis polyprenyl glycosylphosphotransferase [Anaerolineae bacterium]